MNKYTKFTINEKKKENNYEFKWTVFICKPHADDQIIQYTMTLYCYASYENIDVLSMKFLNLFLVPEIRKKH